MRKEVDIRYIPGIEGLSESGFIQAMLDGAQHGQVGCVNWKDYPYAPDVRVSVAYSDNALAILFRVREEHIRGYALEENGPVWEDSCVETFIKDPVGEGYYNIEVNCIGTLLAAHRLSRTDFEHFDAGRLARIRCFSSLPHQVTDLTDAEDKEWSIGEIIPFDILGLEAAPRSLEVNFYKCGDMCRRPHYLSWSPIDLPEPNFHCPEFFGKINL